MFPNMALQMTRIGEETGALDSMLSKVADFMSVKWTTPWRIVIVDRTIMIVFLGVVSARSWWRCICPSSNSVRWYRDLAVSCGRRFAQEPWLFLICCRPFGALIGSFERRHLPLAGDDGTRLAR